MKIRLRKKQKREVKRFAEYMVSGGAQFWSGYAGYAILDAVFHVPFWWAKSLAYFFGVTINYGLERFWVFRKKNITKKQIQTSAGKFYLLMIVDYLIDLGIVGGLREIGITPYIGQFISSGFFTVWNWVLFKIWVFSKHKHRSPGLPGARRSRSRRKPSRSAAVSKAPVLTQRIEYTPRSVLRLFRASDSSERRLVTEECSPGLPAARRSTVLLSSSW